MHLQSKENKIITDNDRREGGEGGAREATQYNGKAHELWSPSRFLSVHILLIPSAYTKECQAYLQCECLLLGCNGAVLNCSREEIHVKNCLKYSLKLTES